MNSKKIILTVGVLVLQISLILGCRVVYYRNRTVHIRQSGPKSLGDPQAPVHIIEYMDFQCPACAKGAKVLKDYMARYPQQIFLEYHHFPIFQIHRYAIKSAMYAECASEQGRFWPFYNLLIERRDKWAESIGAGWQFKEMAKEAGLDMDRMEACIEDDATMNTVMKDKQSGENLKIMSTPTYFVNGRMTVGIKSLENELDQLLPMEGSQK